MKKTIKRCRAILIALLLLCALAECGILTGIVLSGKRLNAPEAADALIILGAQIYPNGKPAPNLRRRLDVAVSLFEQGYAPRIITTGARGHDEPIPEAEAMKAYLAAAGIPEDAIICEAASYSTLENLANAKKIMDGEGYTSAIIVTSDYHLWRALSICKSLSIHATGAGAKGADTWLLSVRNHLRESASWLKYALTQEIWN